MGNAQDQALKTENSWQNQAQFQKYTALDVALKNQIIMTLEPVFLSPLVDQLTWSWKVSAINILQHLFSSYGTIDEIDLEENAVKMMGTYYPIEPLAQLIEQLKNGREFARSGGGDNCWHHDGVKMDSPSSIDGDI